MTETTATAAPKKVQFNARFRPELKREIKMESAQADCQIDVIVEAILTKFFKELTPAERMQVYQDHEKATASAATA